MDTTIVNDTHNREGCSLCAEHARAARLLLHALEALLDNGGLDITFINQRELNVRTVLRNGVVDRGAVVDFAEVLRREIDYGVRGDAA
jgi:hypothetical protein